MARTKKCDECKKSCIKEQMIQVDYMTKNGNVRTKSYCSDKCLKEQEVRKQLIEDTNNLLEFILEIPVRTNMYFNKLYSPIVSYYGYRSIYNMLNSEYSYICDALKKDFVSTNAKIKYFMAIVQDRIDGYKNIDKIENVLEQETNIEVVEVPKVEFKSKSKKSIFDI